jgi:hypothetical protein
VRRALPILLLALALLAAGCGATSVYKAGPSAKCLSGKGYRVTTDPGRIGVIAAAAPHGGLRAFEPGNAVTIAFASDTGDAVAIERAFKRFAPPRLQRHIADVMRTQKNAVLLWTVTPPLGEASKVLDCLRG